MTQRAILIQFILIFVLTSLTACEAIGDIFKAGIWVGIVLVVLIGGLVFWLIGKFRG